MDHQTKVDPTPDQTYTPILAQSPTPYTPPSQYTTITIHPPSYNSYPHTPPSYNRTFIQLNQCGALLNGPHISPAAPAAAAASDPDTKAPQKLLQVF